MLVNTDEMRAPGTAHNDEENKNEHFKFTVSWEHLTRAKASRFTEVLFLFVGNWVEALVGERPEYDELI